MKPMSNKDWARRQGERQEEKLRDPDIASLYWLADKEFERMMERAMDSPTLSGEKE